MAREKSKRKNQTSIVTILFADIKGYSKLDMRQKLVLRENVEVSAHQAIIDGIGHESIKYYNSWGDAYMILFSSVESGIYAAVALRDNFVSRLDLNKLGLPKDLSIRCSLHAGDVLIKNIESPIHGKKKLSVIGKNVDLTARIEPVTPPGRIWATEQVVRLLDDQSPSGIRCDPIGARELAKGWGMRNLYDIRKTLDKKIRDSDFPVTCTPLEIIAPKEIEKPSTPLRKTLLLLCGASSVGKDAIASRIRGRLTQLGLEGKYCNKYTTRPKRPTEDIPMDGRWFEPSSQYIFVDEETFKKDTDIVGKYEKYGCQYGFSQKDLKSDRLSHRLLIAIYGDLDSLIDFSKIVKKTFKREVFIVLLEAQQSDLETRLVTRPGLSGHVIESKKEEMRRDVARLQRLSFDEGQIVINNSNLDNPDDVTEVLLRTFLERTGHLKKHKQ